MATTSGNLATSTALAAGQGGDGNRGRYGLKAKLAAGVATLGCVAALAFGGAQAGRTAQVSPAAPAPAQLLAGTDDLATTGCIGTAGPFACQAGQALAWTDDLATTGCVGAAGPFACATTLSTVAGTDDLIPNGCVGTMGPFGCATALPVTNGGTNDLATNSCIGTAGPFACASVPPPGPANFRSVDD